MSLRQKFENVAPLFEAGGRYHKYYPIYEMVETFVYAINTPTKVAPHVRQDLDLKRTMIYVVLATIPALLFGLYNVGYQANWVLQGMGVTETEGWRSLILDVVGYNPNNIFANVIHGLMYWLPIYVVTVVVGGACEVVFSLIRKHEVNEGFLVTSILYSLILPPNTPLWMVAIGIIFGVVIGKEVFGGTGKNFLNPALVARAFLYFAYPASLSGDSVWRVVDGAGKLDGYSGATILGVGANQGPAAFADFGFTWWDAFMGFVPGSIAETSTFAILLGGVFLLGTKIGNWRMVAGCMIGMIGLSSLLNAIGSDTNPMFGLPWHWHLVAGGFAFGMIFMVTEPVSGSMTNTGRWIYGALIGTACVFIRVINPAFPEGMMLAILFGNIFAPLIDYAIIKANISRRMQRHV
ncbi:MAG: NADH:ubiquinone reductase (Na(+)-transporting) subunit B [Alphaproteobacteria bacterium]|nr:NADH:ubiquinone reductase (Na(+)-transporting) subunit B [Alphaproteobacteria bacterium]